MPRQQAFETLALLSNTPLPLLVLTAAQQIEGRRPQQEQQRQDHSWQRQQHPHPAAHTKGALKVEPKFSADRRPHTKRGWVAVSA